MLRILSLLPLCFSAVASAEAPATEREKAEVITWVKATLKDPESAQFRGIKRLDNGNFCGWVNAKNGFGGYTGFAVFFVGKDKHDLPPLPPELSEPALCS